MAEETVQDQNANQPVEVNSQADIEVRVLPDEGKDVPVLDDG